MNAVLRSECSAFDDLDEQRGVLGRSPQRLPDLGGLRVLDGFGAFVPPNTNARAIPRDYAGRRGRRRDRIET